MDKEFDLDLTYITERIIGKFWHSQCTRHAHCSQKFNNFPRSLINYQKIDSFIQTDAQKEMELEIKESTV